jgi:hypothetical protein
MEALQMLKFHLKKVRLDFTKGWVMQEKDMINNIPDDDPAILLLKGNQDAIDNIMHDEPDDE